MGKKHKKHRGEKGPELGLAAGEYVEKPLKLVLKVGGGEVKELSASRLGHDASFYGDRLEHEKHKDKKKKKKRKEEKPTEEEKKVEKKKVDKKKDGKNKEDRKKDEKKKKQPNTMVFFWKDGYLKIPLKKLQLSKSFRGIGAYVTK